MHLSDLLSKRACVITHWSTLCRSITRSSCTGLKPRACGGRVPPICNPHVPGDGQIWGNTAITHRWNPLGRRGRTKYVCGHACVCMVACVRSCACVPVFFCVIHWFHSISFTRAQGIPKYKIGVGKEKDGRVGERLVEGGGGHGARDGGWISVCACARVCVCGCAAIHSMVYMSPPVAAMAFSRSITQEAGLAVAAALGVDPEVAAPRIRRVPKREFALGYCRPAPIDLLLRVQPPCRMHVPLGLRFRARKRGHNTALLASPHRR